MPRIINVGDVVKALEIAACRLGDTERSEATLLAWAEASRITPAGQRLTVEAVTKGIECWREQRKRQELQGTGATVPAGNKADLLPTDAQRPATPMTNLSKRPRSDEAQESSVQASSMVPSAAQEGSGVEKNNGSLAEADEPTSKRIKKAASAWKEAKRKREQENQRVEELTKQRMHEVVKEIQAHMEEILRRSGDAKALQKWAEAPADMDRRELYMRLVHAERDPDVQIPEELCAELLPHQVEGLEWLASLYGNGLHGILADEMGLGKTIQTISLLLYIKERKANVGPHLIVAPKSTLSNWQAEFEKFAPGYHVCVVAGEKEERELTLHALRKAISQNQAVACVTNYEQVYRNEWLLQNPWQLIVVDEGHRLKNPETVLHTAMKKLNCRMRLLLTGTPLQNSLNELWALLHYLLPDLFTNMMDFKAWFAKPFAGIEGLNEFSVQMGPEQEQEVIAQMHSLLAPFLLQRLKSEVLGDRLPPRVEQTIRVPLSAWQQAAYKDLERKTIRLLGEDDSVSSEQVNNALMQLRKIVLHPYLFQDTYRCNDDLYRTSGKMEALDRLLQKLLRFDHKVLIFSQFTSVLDIIENFLTWRNISQVRIDGSVKHEARKDRLRRFQEEGSSISVFLLSARAGSLGLNLQAADTVILFDMDWNPQNDKQAIARVHRVGQTREVRVVRLVTDSIVERHMEQRCKEKLEMEKKIMGAGMFRKAVTADQRRQALREVLGLQAAEAGASSAGSEQPSSGMPATGTGKDLSTPDEVNEVLSRSDAERKSFQEMDAKALRPIKGAGGKDVPQLVRCGRLMQSSEVPDGFQALRDLDD